MGADFCEQAAVLVLSIAQAQAFFEGNKRTALASLTGFVLNNGRRYVGDPMELANILEAASSSDEVLADLTGLMRKHLVPN